MRSLWAFLFAWSWLALFLTLLELLAINFFLLTLFNIFKVLRYPFNSRRIFSRSSLFLVLLSCLTLFRKVALLLGLASKFLRIKFLSFCSRSKLPINTNNSSLLVLILSTSNCLASSKIAFAVDVLLPNFSMKDARFWFVISRLVRDFNNFFFFPNLFSLIIWFFSLSASLFSVPTLVTWLSKAFNKEFFLVLFKPKELA